ncbi:hypothetical protein D9M71_523790 [compost metagenome]
MQVPHQRFTGLISGCQRFAPDPGGERGNALATVDLAVVEQGEQCQFLDEAQRCIRHRRTRRGVAFLQLETITLRLGGDFLLAQLVALIAGTALDSPLVARLMVIVLATHALERVTK